MIIGILPEYLFIVQSTWVQALKSFWVIHKIISHSLHSFPSAKFSPNFEGISHLIPICLALLIAVAMQTILEFQPFTAPCTNSQVKIHYNIVMCLLTFGKGDLVLLDAFTSIVFFLISYSITGDMLRNHK